MVLLPNLIGSSTDLSPSKKTSLKRYKEIQKGVFNGRNIRFGVGNMQWVLYLMDLLLIKVSEFIGPLSFFSDYMRPSIRLAALMKLSIIYTFTHDSIYVGEDGCFTPLTGRTA